jgi:hypothetical protein
VRRDIHLDFFGLLCCDPGRRRDGMTLRVRLPKVQLKHTLAPLG